MPPSARERRVVWLHGLIARCHIILWRHVGVSMLLNRPLLAAASTGCRLTWRTWTPGGWGRCCCSTSPPSASPTSSPPRCCPAKTAAEGACQRDAFRVTADAKHSWVRAHMLQQSLLATRWRPGQQLSGRLMRLAPGLWATRRAGMTWLDAFFH